LKPGIAYCTDRDLDTWRLYMSAWLAHSQAEQGRYTAAERHLADILRHPHLSPINRVCALPVAGVLAARRGADTTVLDEALPIALATGEPQRLVPVAAARAEAAWIAGRAADIPAEIDHAWPLPSRIRSPGAWASCAGGCTSPGTAGRSPRPSPGPSPSCWRAVTAWPPVNGET